MSEKSPKASDAEIELRIKEVTDLLLDGQTRHAILRYAAENWGVKTRQCEEYMARAKDQIKEINLASIQDNMALIARNLWNCFRAAKALQDVGEAHRILMSIAKLKGLGSENVTHIIEDKRDFQDMPDEELDKLLMEEGH